jgi:hypothetical protein
MTHPGGPLVEVAAVVVVGETNRLGVRGGGEGGERQASVSLRACLHSTV